MLQLGQKLNVSDPGKSLHGESGQFEATSQATNERFRIECRHTGAGSIVSFVSVDNPGNWTVEKIADYQPQHEQQQTTEGQQPRARARAAGSGGGSNY